MLSDITNLSKNKKTIPMKPIVTPTDFKTFSFSFNINYEAVSHLVAAGGLTTAASGYSTFEGIAPLLYGTLPQPDQAVASFGKISLSTNY